MDELIPWSKPRLSDLEISNVTRALESTWISGGAFVEEFETRLAKLLDVNEVIAVSNGTTALQLALLSLDLQEHDEVIVPGYTFIAAASMVLATKATLVTVDVCPDTFLLDPEQLEGVISPRTRAIIPVHLYGNVAEMDRICEIARQHDVAVIEDAAEAIFSQYNGKMAGTLGDIGTFSFHATKTITTGEGGAVVTNDLALATKMRLIRDHGMNKQKRYWHDIAGYNFRLTNMQAAIGCAQLEVLDETLAERQRIHQDYQRCLDSHPEVALQKFNPAVSPVLWACSVRLTGYDNHDPETMITIRNNLIQRLLEMNIETRPGFYAISMLPPYETEELPVSLALSARIISLPTFVGLSSSQIEEVCSTLLSQIKKAK